MKYLRIVAVSALSALLAGCFNSTTVISVKPDGSGTIEQTTTMSPQALAQMQQMTGGMGPPRHPAS
jgi:hypothetical protein